MPEPSSISKRIAKNTFSMYLRMLFLMLISFYTSRVVLKALGADDFGTYNVVGSVVVLFTFINAAMTTGTQRHLSYELGRSNGDVGLVFSACLNIHFWLAIVIFLLSETVGLWFVNNQLNFPDGRLHAVNWVYQFSIIACIFNIIRVPYNALIIAYERMSFFAHIGIIEGFLKLFIVYLLSLTAIDKLIAYSFLIAFVIGAITFCHFLYCRISFRDVHLVKVHNGLLYKRLLGFSGWTLFGSFANLARNQGVSFIINIFYGVTLNAALGIANQVNTGISQFVSGFQQAFNPQLTKTEASKDRDYQQLLVERTAKFSFFIILFVSLPVLYNLHYLLGFWLGDYPYSTESLCVWIIIASLIDSISGPLWVSIFATGNIKSYQLVISVFLLLSLPLAILCGVLGWAPQYIFAVQACLNFIAIFIRLFYLRKLIHFDIWSFTQKVFIPIVLVTLIIVPTIFNVLRSPRADSFLQFIIQSLLIALFEVLIISFIGLTKSERTGLIKIVKSRS